MKAKVKPKDRIIVALDVRVDVKGLEKAQKLVRSLTRHVGVFKIGLEFITGALGELLSGRNTALVMLQLDKFRELFERLSGRFFWDGKWADIPNTVGAAALAVQPLRPMFINVHASAGLEAIKAAVANKGESKVLGVTVLTSIDEAECFSIFGRKPDEKVVQFARKILEAGADGIICSPQELERLRDYDMFHQLLKVTPGVRPDWAAVGDQKRVMPPGKAIERGADYLVIGRPITNPPEEIGKPVDAAKKIAEEIAAAL